MLSGEGTKGGPLWVVQRLVKQTDNLGALPAERILAGAWQLGGLAGSHGSGPRGYSQSHRTHPTLARSEAFGSPTARALHLGLHNLSLLCQLCQSTFAALDGYRVDSFRTCQREFGHFNSAMRTSEIATNIEQLSGEDKKQLMAALNAPGTPSAR